MTQNSKKCIGIMYMSSSSICSFMIVRCLVTWIYQHINNCISLEPVGGDLIKLVTAEVFFSKTKKNTRPSAYIGPISAEFV
jgi:hypothetical protein